MRRVMLFLLCGLMASCDAPEKPLVEPTTPKPTPKQVTEAPSQKSPKAQPPKPSKQPTPQQALTGYRRAIEKARSVSEQVKKQREEDEAQERLIK